MLNELRFAFRMLLKNPIFSLIAIATMFASYIPARRATKADPMIALGHAQ